MDRSILRLRSSLVATCLTLVLAGVTNAQTRVTFDIPDAIECRDVTPEKCAAEHPGLKAIEGKFRLSARIIKGSEADVVDFLYVLVSPGLRLKIHDYLPNTTLESALAEDHIEVAENTESTASATEDAHVGYKIFTLGGSLNQTSKKTESNHYKQIVPKALVLASGTTNREHGVFFKLRPSNGALLEGAKEFTFLAVVPKSWRGDWCTIACAARSRKKSFLPGDPALAGIERAHVGLYLSGDRNAASLAEEMCMLQEQNAAIFARQLAAEADLLLASMHETTASDHAILGSDTWWHGIFRNRAASDEAARAAAALRKYSKSTRGARWGSEIGAGREQDGVFLRIAMRKKPRLPADRPARWTTSTRFSRTYVFFRCAKRVMRLTPFGPSVSSELSQCYSSLRGI